VPGKELQQRVLSPIFTEFPKLKCSAKINTICETAKRFFKGVGNNMPCRQAGNGFHFFEMMHAGKK
jgi:hypothetical protein